MSMKAYMPVESGEDSIRDYFNETNLEYFLGLYDVDKTDLASGNNRTRMLVDSIVPSDKLALSGRGALLHTTDGALIDFQSMTVNCILGQNDPWVKIHQVAYLLSERPSFHSTKLGSELYYSLPERLIKLGIGGIEDPVISHRQCNGSDVVEHAIKAACTRIPDRKYVISFKGSYHGQTLGTFAVSDVQKDHVFMVSGTNTVFLPQPTSALTVSDDAPLSREEEETISKLGNLAPNAFAVILEPIQVNNGVQPFSKSFLKAIKEVCDKADTCLIYDEIQTGFGWLGKMSAAELYGVVPSTIAFGKALTSGNGPLALTMSERKYQHMVYGTASKTNGSDMRSLVAAHAVLDRLFGIPKCDIPNFIQGSLRDELKTGLLKVVPEKAEALDKHLVQLRDNHPNMVGNLKGGGLLRGVEVLGEDGKPDVSRANEVMDRCFDTGVFLRTSGATLIIKPPAVITPAQMDVGFHILNEAVDFIAHKPISKFVKSERLKQLATH